MANQLKMAVVNAIITLKQRKWSNRRIARELGIDRETVKRHLELAKDGSNPVSDPTIGTDNSKPATNAPPGSEEAKPATNAPTGLLAEYTDDDQDQSSKLSGPDSQCEPFREIIKGKLEQELAAKRIHQDLVVDYGFPSNHRRVHRLYGKRFLAFRRCSQDTDY